MRMPHSGRFWAYVGTVGGVTVSAAVNYLETSSNADVPAKYALPAAILMALLPVGLFVALEVLVRNRVKDHLNWWRGGMLITALAFAIPSYIHMHDLLEDWGQHAVICLVTPFGWDGLMLLSTLALLMDPDKTRQPGEQAPLTRYEWILSIPQPPPVTTVRQIRPKAIRPVEPPKAIETPKTVISTKRFDRPSDHPLYAEWARAEGTDAQWSNKEFAARSGKSVAAARNQVVRWREFLAKTGQVNGNQYELEMK